MGRRRMLNRDYFQLNAKEMRRTLPNRNYKQEYKLQEIKSHKEWPPR